MEKLIQLCEVLKNADNYPWDLDLFLPKDKNWCLSSECALLNTDDLEEDTEIPEFAVEHNMAYVLTMSEIQDIVANARQQRENYSDTDLIEAFLFYYKNDAFIVYNK